LVDVHDLSCFLLLIILKSFINFKTYYAMEKFTKILATTVAVATGVASVGTAILAALSANKK